MLKSDDKSSETIRIVESKTVLQDALAVRIVHDGEVYILRITKSNKLILTK